MANRPDSEPFRRARARFFEQGKAEDAPCWICRGTEGPIDYDAAPGAPLSHTLDHIHPVSTHPELYNDPANFAHAHQKCNSSRGAKAPTVKCSVIPRMWG